jgi:3-hydroxyacyl-[acyl-carrier-protein] dehydratase
VKNNWDIKEIMNYLPQRYPFLFIDRVLEVNVEKRKVVCLKNVTRNEQFFNGHFPDNPIMPGALIIEAMAQASIILYTTLKPDIAMQKPDYYLGTVKANFLKPVDVGSQLIIEIVADKILNNAGIVKAVAKVNNEIVAKSDIIFGIRLKQ